MNAAPSSAPRIWTPLTIAVVVLFLAALALPLVTALPPLIHFDPMPPRGNCQSNVRQLASALRMYMSDYEGHLPPAGAWQDLSYSYVKNEATFRCWLRPKVNPGYAFNQALDGSVLKEVRIPAKTPLLYESRIGKRNATDHLESFVTPHQGLGFMAFTDGHAKALKVAPAAIPSPGSEAP